MLGASYVEGNTESEGEAIKVPMRLWSLAAVLRKQGNDNLSRDSDEAHLKLVMDSFARGIIA